MCKFNVIIHQEPNGEYWAEVPALPGCFAMGQSREELLEGVREAITMHLDTLNENDIPVGAQLERIAL